MYWTLTLKIILVCILYTFFGCISSSNSTNLTHQPAGKNYKWWFNQKEKEVKKWSVRRDKNILWEVPLEETGQNGIIKVGDLLFLSIMKPVYDTITKRGTDIFALCYNALTGEKVWQREITGTTESLYMYGFSNSSSPTPVSDGEKVWFINASGKVVCFDLDGNQIWERSWRPISKIGKIVFKFRTKHFKSIKNYDGCLDSFLRVYALCLSMKKFFKSKKLKKIKNDSIKGDDYYIIHPVLKNLSILQK